MTTGFLDVDSWVAEALEQGDFRYAKAVVIEHAECISVSDRDKLLAIIAEAKERKLPHSD